MVKSQDFDLTPKTEKEGREKIPYGDFFLSDLMLWVAKLYPTCILLICSYPRSWHSLIRFHAIISFINFPLSCHFVEKVSSLVIMLDTVVTQIRSLCYMLHRDMDTESSAVLQLLRLDAGLCRTWVLLDFLITMKFLINPWQLVSFINALNEFQGIK